ncbi:hypothetical protein FRACYDRAFT_249499 [Fragilariopsis cylindrus CCMP1102]|uniref:Methyltransferase FkbM domain-containing protein n=1 Tax=Fragilariopsis cylindrus CCMP1102 TaxID=635003 RepID=A0A1E7ERJ1_9STRA|nr:hypothetical protein FRACYDRAFT_249499 [Fragilariopsis cylindrus CCMP1102]|eukprot:OEU08608.1 hypothetical protein FRACYDRAFT_249499 [Fragilariopsis cylindrus CCMP1102]
MKLSNNARVSGPRRTSYNSKKKKNKGHHDESNGGKSCTTGLMPMMLMLIFVRVTSVIISTRENTSIMNSLMNTNPVSLEEQGLLQSSSSSLVDGGGDGDSRDGATVIIGKDSESESKSKSVHNDNDFAKQCTRTELLKIRSFLIPEFCVESLQRNNMFTQQCSITLATKCPNSALWLDEYYIELHKERLLLRSASTSTTAAATSPSFLGISVGCNKGFDAINTLRMGTNDDTISKVDWQNAMVENDGTLYKSVCGQDSIHDVFQTVVEEKNQSSLPSSSLIQGTNGGSSSGSGSVSGEMHCIEPMPQTYNKLHHSATTLKYETKGLTVTHAAISKESNENGMLFPSGEAGGIENLGLETCQNKAYIRKSQYKCITVPVLSLKDYITTKVGVTPSVEDDNNIRIINILSIDVEGFDGDVILGSSSDVLNRVEYLEFEYNWMGSWRQQHLYDIITMLYEQESSMVCYWAGIDKLWRITNCWMLYYDIHTWSNVACVNTKLVPRLAMKMETIFQNTINIDLIVKVKLYHMNM